MSAAGDADGDAHRRPPRKTSNTAATRSLLDAGRASYTDLIGDRSGRARSCSARGRDSFIDPFLQPTLRSRRD